MDLLLHCLAVTTLPELLDKSFGVSFSNQYYLKQYDSNIKYEDINFFDHVTYTIDTYENKVVSKYPYFTNRDRHLNNFCL